jgi:hypothetical protein
LSGLLRGSSKIHSRLRAPQDQGERQFLLTFLLRARD